MCSVAAWSCTLSCSCIFLWEIAAKHAHTHSHTLTYTDAQVLGDGRSLSLRHVDGSVTSLFNDDDVDTASLSHLLSVLAYLVPKERRRSDLDSDSDVSGSSGDARHVSSAEVVTDATSGKHAHAQRSLEPSQLDETSRPNEAQARSGGRRLFYTQTHQTTQSDTAAADAVSNVGEPLSAGGLILGHAALLRELLVATAVGQSCACGVSAEALYYACDAGGAGAGRVGEHHGGDVVDVHNVSEHATSHMGGQHEGDLVRMRSGGGLQRLAIADIGDVISSDAGTVNVTGHTKGAMVHACRSCMRSIVAVLTPRLGFCCPPRHAYHSHHLSTVSMSLRSARARCGEKTHAHLHVHRPTHAYTLGRIVQR